MLINTLEGTDCKSDSSRTHIVASSEAQSQASGVFSYVKFVNDGYGGVAAVVLPKWLKAKFVPRGLPIPNLYL